MLKEQPSLTSIHPELRRLIVQATEGVLISPEQFLSLTTKEDRDYFVSRDLDFPGALIRSYAVSFSNDMRLGISAVNTEEAA